jgi:methylmalonyl-CoA/ethylmalonyl-CoA epimerase
MKFHHLGIACQDIQETLQFVKNVHNVVNVSDIIYDPLQDASLCMLTIKDGVNIELITGGAVATLLKKRISLYHTCYEVDNITETINHLVQNGAIIISEPKNAVLFNNKKVAFVHTPTGIIELLEGDASHV